MIILIYRGELSSTSHWYRLKGSDGNGFYQDYTIVSGSYPKPSSTESVWDFRCLSHRHNRLEALLALVQMTGVNPGMGN